MTARPVPGPRAKAAHLSPALLRNAFGAFATGVVVIGAPSGGGEPIGMTVNSFTSVSLDPPLVLFCPARSSMGIAIYSTARFFSASVLRQEQKWISDRFARPSQASKWTGIPHHLLDTGVPIIEDALVSFECEVESRFDGGDHLVLLARVLSIAAGPEGQPLVFFQSRYRSLAKLEAEPAEHRPAFRGWAK